MCFMGGGGGSSRDYAKEAEERRKAEEEAKKKADQDKLEAQREGVASTQDDDTGYLGVQQDLQPTQQAGTQPKKKPNLLS